MVKGTGGTMALLASMIVESLPSIIAHSSSLGNEIIDHILHPLIFIRKADHFPEETREWLSIPLGPLSIAMYGQDFAAELVSAILVLTMHVTSVQDTAMVMDGCFMLLRCMVITSSPNVWLEQLLQHGLLPCIASAAYATAGAE
jgi:hypothetical protein